MLGLLKFPTVWIRRKNLWLFVFEMHMILRKFVGYYSHDKQIREDINELEYQAKVTFPNGNHRTLPQRDKEKGNTRDGSSQWV